MTKPVSDWNEPPAAVVAPPDFNNLLAILRRERPRRPTLFELFLNARLHKRLVPNPDPAWENDLIGDMMTIRAMHRAGYDYASVWVHGFSFPAGKVHQEASKSLNEGALIKDRASFDAYKWPDPDAADYSIFERLQPHLPPGMKIIMISPGGVLENAIQLVGYDVLCLMIGDDESLVFDVFEAVGSRLARLYQNAVKYPSVGAVIGNDDWGFKSQTMLSPKDLRRFVFPWHKEIVRAAHAAGKPAILHSCGCLNEVMDDVIDDIKYDAKHSYEDIIRPVEQAYDLYHRRIAVIGGIDIDFMCRSAPEEVYRRSQRMLEHAADGAYALGSGSSVAEYVPDAAYFAMNRAALDLR